MLLINQVVEKSMSANQGFNSLSKLGYKIFNANIIRESN